MIIVVGRDQASFYDFLKPRQEAEGRGRVFLDRRFGERRRPQAVAGTPDRRKSDRRARISDAERALMSVLGFTVVDREAAERREPAPVTTAGAAARKPGATIRRAPTRKAGGPGSKRRPATG